MAFGRKIAKKLAARRVAYDNRGSGNPGKAGMAMHRPGSQNRNKK